VRGDLSCGPDGADILDSCDGQLVYDVHACSRREELVSRTNGAVQSFVDVEFWSELGKRKLNVLRLSEEALPLRGTSNHVTSLAHITLHIFDVPGGTDYRTILCSDSLNR
jgi:hypothetical protein